MVVCVQESLVTSPYTIFHTRCSGDAWRKYNGSVLMHMLALSLLSLIGFGAACLLTRAGDPTGFPIVLGILAITTPFTLLREMARRIEFARLRVNVANWIDGAVTLLQIAFLGLYAWSGELNAARAFMAVGIASAIGAGVWLVTLRGIFSVDRGAIWQDFREGWRVGKWVFLAQLTGLLHLQGMFWLVAAVQGPSQTGIFAACSTLVLFINPFALGLNNFIGPLTVKAAASEGLEAVRRLTAKAMAFMGLSVLIFALVLFSLSDQILILLFDNPSYTGNRWLILVLGLNLVFNSMHMVNEGGLWAIERPQFIFWCTLLAVVVTFTPAIPMLNNLGLLGAGLCLVAGRLIALLVCSALFFFVVDSSVHHAKASD
jgi:O-antigen/teichoic acid export membrane protein